jgi:two-component system, NtrC family, sensor kinase
MNSLSLLPFPIPDNDAERIATLYDYNILDTLPEQDYDDLTAIAAQICGTPVSMISLVDHDRQWFKSRHGLEATETPREQAFCSHAILRPEQVLVVPDTREDDRFAHNPLVTGEMGVQFYAGAPLVTSEGHALGTICVIDQKPHQMTESQIQALQALSRQTVAQMELRRRTLALSQEVELRKRTAELAVAKSQALEQTLQQLQHTQATLIQSEKMSALGQLVAGIAHEINNPISFIHGNLSHCKQYADNLLSLVNLYPAIVTEVPEIAAMRQQIELDYLVSDFPKLLSSMETGTSRIQAIVQSLRTFSRLDETGVKKVDLQENLDAILTILEGRCQATAQRPAIQLVCCYEPTLPVVCNIKDLNQVFMQLLYNAIEALETGTGTAATGMPTVTIGVQQVEDYVCVSIADNGEGMSEAIQARIFEPFYTTKPVGQGTGMGLAMSYQVVVEQHGGRLECRSRLGHGSEFRVALPLKG